MAKYVRRNPEGDITAVFSNPPVGEVSFIEDDDPELVAFLAALENLVDLPDPVISRLLDELEAILPGIKNRILS